MKWTALVPLKPTGQRKTRLAPFLSADERDRLSEFMFAHVISVLAQQPRIGQVILLASERPASWPWAFAADRGRGLNVELACARSALRAVPLLVLPADLPLLRAEDIATLLAAPSGTPAVAPDRQGRGTNALALPPLYPFQFRFGPNSFRRHRTQMTKARIVRRLGLALDLDTERDLARAVAAAAHLHTHYTNGPNR
jgi:2-phospho-L-lactate/phosphoenolpyruvate guanylyltransferase